MEQLETITNEINNKPVETENHLPEEATETQSRQLDRVTRATEFSQTLDKSNINILKDAAVTDQKFVKDLKREIKEAALKNAQNEKEKQELEKQNTEYARELLETQQQLNKLQQVQDKWDNREKRRQFHYNGVRPIMEFVGIKTSMNLICLYFLTIVLTPFYLINKFFKGTIGALVFGAEDSNRSKAMKGFLWTMLALIMIIIIGFSVYAMGHYVFKWF